MLHASTSKILTKGVQKYKQSEAKRAHPPPMLALELPISELLTKVHTPKTPSETLKK
jgi:hypothetical protein